MNDAIFQTVALMSSSALIFITEPALNRCTGATRLCARFALLLICAGAVLVAAAAIPGAFPSPWPGAAALSSGVALMLYTTRRRRMRHDPG